MFHPPSTKRPTMQRPHACHGHPSPKQRYRTTFPDERVHQYEFSEQSYPRTFQTRYSDRSSEFPHHIDNPRPIPVTHSHPPPRMLPQNQRYQARSQNGPQSRRQNDEQTHTHTHGGGSGAEQQAGAGAGHSLRAVIIFDTLRPGRPEDWRWIWGTGWHFLGDLGSRHARPVKMVSANEFVW